MTLQAGLEHLETYGADINRWPEALQQDFADLLTSSPEFSKRHDEIKELDAALAGFEDTDQPDEHDTSVMSADETDEKSDERDGSGTPPPEGDEEEDEESAFDYEEDDFDAPPQDDIGDDDDLSDDEEGDEDQDDEESGDHEQSGDEGDATDADQGGKGSPPPSHGDDEDDDLGPSDPSQIPDMDDMLDEQPEGGGPPPKPEVDIDPSAIEEFEEEDAEPLDIDLDDIKDLDDALAEILSQQMQGAFDGHLQVDFTRDFDQVVEAPSDGDYDVGKFEDRVRKQTGVMQKDLQRLIVARAKSFHVGGYRTGKINSPALHRAVSGDERVFRRKVTQTTQATAMTLLVDCSGSMSGSKIKTAMEAAFAFADILDRLKIPCEVLGFTTGEYPDGHNWNTFSEEVEKMRVDTGLPRGVIRFGPTVVRIYKAFGERFMVEQKKRMVRMVQTEEGMGSNNDAMALEYASSRLMLRQEPRKIMIVFSDGRPADMGVTQEVIGHTMKAIIKRLDKQGVETIGIGIEDATVKAYYAKSMVIQNVSQLPGMVMKELKKLLLG
jgi:cobaltochelatase CobT